MLALWHEDTADLTAGWSGTCADVDMAFEDSRDKSFYSPAPRGGYCVLGTGLDMCFCSQCVSNAFMHDSGERKQRERSICGDFDAGWSKESADTGGSLDVPASGLQLDAGWSKASAVAGGSLDAATLAAAGVPTSPLRTKSPCAKPVRAALVPHHGGCELSAEREMKILERKKKNQEHARLSRIRQNERLAAMKQRKAELEVECARLTAARQTLEHEQKTLKAELLVDVLLC